MKRYVSFIGSLLFHQMLPDKPSEKQLKFVEELTKKYCSLAYTLGYKLTENGDNVKVGSFSELDIAFANGAVEGAKKKNQNPKELIYQIIGDFTKEKYLHTDAGQIRMPTEDDFISGRSVFISHAKAIVLLGGHHYAKMLGSWAINMGIPVIALPQGKLAGEDIWKYLIADSHFTDESKDIFPGISKEDFEEIGILNAEADWLAMKVFSMIENSSKVWVKPSLLPHEMRYKPKTNQVIVNHAFIAMSFSEKKENTFNSIYQACVDAGFVGFRGDNKSFYHKDLNIMANITESIVRSHVIIVDVSDRNPNVFYEMGIADTLGKPMILLFDGNGDMPFDVQGLRHLRYNENKPENLIEPLIEILKGFKN